jgi:hypothetical protein
VNNQEKFKTDYFVNTWMMSHVCMMDHPYGDTMKHYEYKRFKYVYEKSWGSFGFFGYRKFFIPLHKHNHWMLFEVDHQSK